MEVGKSDHVLIFDFDGVIANAPHLSSWRDAASDEGLVARDYDLKEFYNREMAAVPREKAAQALVDRFAPSRSADAELVSRLVSGKQANFQRLIDAGEFLVYEDIMKISIDAHRRGIPTGVCSVSMNALNILSKIDVKKYAWKYFGLNGQFKPKTAIEMFPVVVAGASNYKGLDKSGMYQLVYSKLRERFPIADGARVIAWEDTDVGVKAARGAGFYCVGIQRNGHITRQMLLDAGAGVSLTTSELERRTLDDFISY